MVQTPLCYAHARLALLPLAVSASLFAVTANAATIGTTQIDSAQHEPISATIEVRDIDPDNFSASLAPKSMYQQMNMNADVAIDVRFVKTSSSSGKIILTSVQPVSDPFADVVLTVNDKGRQQTVPKTLLLLLGHARRPSQTPSKIIGTKPRPNLPKISNTTAVNTLPPMTTMGKPLAVKRKAPPPLVPSQPNIAVATTKTGKTLPSAPTFTLAAKPQMATASPALIIQPIPDTVQPIIIQPNPSGLTSGAMFTKLPALPADAQIAANQPAQPALSNQAVTPTTASSTLAQNQAQPNLSGLSAPVPSNSSTSAAPSSTTSAPSTTASISTPTPAPAPTISAMNTQLDILTTTITRRYSMPPNPANTVVAAAAVATAEALQQPASSTSTLATDSNAKQPIDSNIDKTINNIDAQNDHAQSPAADTPQQTALEGAVTPVTNTNAPAQPGQATVGTSDSIPAIPLGEATYTVQKNDNLWTIAEQIASKNNISINQVMDEILAYNPDAFISGEKSKLLANVPLALPAYEVIPSKLGIQAAKEARQATKLASEQTQAKGRPATQTPADRAKSAATKSAAPKPTANTPKQTSPNTGSAASMLPVAKSVAKPIAKPAPARPSLTLVTPHKGRTSATSPTAGSGGTGLNPELVASLKASRQKTTTQAQRVSAISQQLAERTRTLQLQNQRLANLERRLKKLHALKTNQP